MCSLAFPLPITTFGLLYTYFYFDPFCILDLQRLTISYILLKFTVSIPEGSSAPHDPKVKHNCTVSIWDLATLHMPPRSCTRALPVYFSGGGKSREMGRWTLTNG